ncbi:MAG: J domain-containing protein [Acidobacteria bacterium]|nr:J domain-containing protein [Acidobacteriota bacterium]
MDLYDVLGLRRGASPGDVKRAYRRLARRFHPDINPGDRAADARFRQIAFAYETLIDEDRRRQYDQTGTTDRPVEGPSYGFEGFDFTVEVTSAHDASTFGDLFADVLRRAAGAPAGRQSVRGSDLHATVPLGFLESMRGADCPVTVTRFETCRICSGAGLVQTPETRCPQCRGVGALRSTRGHMVFAKPCEPCGGTGQLQQLACRACDGQGIEPRAETIGVHVPAGAPDGMQIRVPGRGHTGPHGGPAGDLYVRVAVSPHPLFTREGDDLHFHVPVTVHEAGLGARIELPTPSGPARLRVPPGTASGRQFRLHGRGAPSPRTGEPGDLVVEVRIVWPAVVDERSKELLREFGRINNGDVRKDLTL